MVKAEKIRLREVARQQAQALSKDTWQRASEQICRSLEECSVFQEAQSIFFYLSQFPEPQTWGLVKKYYQDKQIAVWGGEGVVWLRSWEFRKDKTDIWTPRQKVNLAGKHSLDLAIIPGVMFDETGNRLGRGGGFFDRWLAERGFPVIALACEWQVKEKIPTQSHDQKIDYLITETKIRKFT